MDKYTFGNRLLELRTKRGLTQKELAKIIGVSNKAVSKWETGETMPRVKTMQKLAEVFSTTYADLLSEDGEVKSYSEDEIYRKKTVEITIKITKVSMVLVLFVAIGIMLMKLASAIMYIAAFERTDGISNLIGVIIINLCLVGLFVYMCKKFKFARDNINTVKHEYFKPIIMWGIIFVFLCLIEAFLLRKPINPALHSIVPCAINILFLLIYYKVYIINKPSEKKVRAVSVALIIPGIINSLSACWMLRRLLHYSDNLDAYLSPLSKNEAINLIEALIVNALYTIGTEILWIILVILTVPVFMEAIFIRDNKELRKKKENVKRNKVLLVLLGIFLFLLSVKLTTEYLLVFLRL